MTDREEAQGEVPDGPGLTGWQGVDAEAIQAGWMTLQGQWLNDPANSNAVTLAYQARLAEIWLNQELPDLAPDPRFEDPEWATHPVFSRIRAAYSLWCDALDEWVARAGLEGIDLQRAQFLLDAAKETYAPVNSPFTPETIRRAVETQGESLVKGLSNYFADLNENHGYPAIADRTAFEVGVDVANTPGEVIYRTPLFELIQYGAATERVHEVPVLYVFSQVNRFYLGDLTPERSLFRRLLESGLQVFAVSWKNPTSDDQHLSLSDYARAVREAVEVSGKIADSSTVDLMGLCAGGVTSATAAALEQSFEGSDVRIGSLSLFVSILDNRPGESDFSLFATDETVAAQKAKVRSQGYANERDILEMFAMLRLDESVFSFVRSNYFRGENPPAHPLLFWSMDYTRVPAEMQCDFIDLSHTNDLATGRLEIEGKTLSLENISYPVYVMAGSTDHITPWRACYRSAHLFGSEPRFVLTNQNHTQTISAKPNRHLRYWTNEELPADADAWLEGADEHEGDWRQDWIDWLKGHSGQKPAPEGCGSGEFAALGEAPGTYVYE